jgi:hypothetical protein
VPIAGIVPAAKGPRLRENFSDAKPGLPLTKLCLINMPAVTQGSPWTRFTPLAARVVAGTSQNESADSVESQGGNCGSQIASKNAPATAVNSSKTLDAYLTIATCREWIALLLQANVGGRTRTAAPALKPQPTRKYGRYGSRWRRPGRSWPKRRSGCRRIKRQGGMLLRSG